jgi:hypothetical protein
MDLPSYVTSFVVDLVRFRLFFAVQLVWLLNPRVATAMPGQPKILLERSPHTDSAVGKPRNTSLSRVFKKLCIHLNTGGGNAIN